ncbi:Pro-kumamolisin, activation domain-containing protein [Hypoxylon sp. NC0597]|nr:Pro-kumamolisin, activation domain-containing protein [Hypoxylon sp. NC0597]
MLFAFFLGVLVAAPAIASPASHSGHVLTRSEKRPPRSRLNVTRSIQKMSLPMRIGLRQSNLKNGDSLLMGVLHPNSPNYGKYYTADDVNKILAPSHETVEVVRGWLGASGISRERVLQSANKAWLQLNADAEEVEELFKTKYHIYQHEDSGTKKVACDEYHLPSHVQEHVDYITLGIRLVLGPNENKRPSAKKRASPTPGRARRTLGTTLLPNSLPLPLGQFSSADLTHCDTVMIINCIRALYKTPKLEKPTPGNELGMYEYADVYNQNDLDRYWRDFAPEILQGYGPEVRGIDGGVATGPQGRGIESYLGLDLAHPLLYPQGIVIYQVEDENYADGSLDHKGLFNNFTRTIPNGRHERIGTDIRVDPGANKRGATSGRQEYCGFREPHVVCSS